MRICGVRGCVVVKVDVCGGRRSPAFGGMPPHSARTVEVFELAGIGFEGVRRGLTERGARRRSSGGDGKRGALPRGDVGCGAGVAVGLRVGGGQRGLDGGG